MNNLLEEYCVALEAQMETIQASSMTPSNIQDHDDNNGGDHKLDLALVEQECDDAKAHNEKLEMEIRQLSESDIEIFSIVKREMQSESIVAKIVDTRSDALCLDSTCSSKLCHCCLTACHIVQYHSAGVIGRGQ